MSKTKTTKNKNTSVITSSGDYVTVIPKADQKQVLRLFNGTKKEKGLTIKELSEQFSVDKRQIMRVLHNSKVREYSHSSLV